VRCILITTALVVLATGSPAAEPGVPARPNILFLVADDLATRLGCYDDPAAMTPNLDRLAASGVVFTHAYCQGVVCTPSRTSFMLGRNNAHAHANSFLDNPELMTLGRWFREHGYQTFSVGKIDHTDEYTDPKAWDIRHNRADVTPRGHLGPRTKLQEDLPQPDGSRLGRLLSHVGIADSADKLHDWAVAERAIHFLDTERDTAKPFFAAVGFHTPHGPLDSTQSAYNAHDPVKFALEDLPADATPLPPKSLLQEPGLAASESLQREATRAYYAAVTMLDEQIGRLLDHLEATGLADNTVIVFTSDHGYHLGWRGQWCKHSLDDQVLRVPLIVRSPRSARAARAEGIVELIDLFPTFCELAAIPAAQSLDGQSFGPLLKDPTAPGKPAAFCRGANGRTVRTARWRYIERSDGSHELYDHDRDPAEYYNVADRPEHASVIRDHAALLTQELGPRKHAQRSAETPDGG
jgi:iduronate 2-sulfatase